MTKESMLDLIKMCDVLEKADRVQELLIGNSLILGLEDGVFGNLSRIWDIIRRECDPLLVDPEINVEENEYYKILVSSSTAEEKVDLLFKDY